MAEKDIPKLKELILWHDNNIHITVENCNFDLCYDDTKSPFIYRWVELETGQKFAELDGWHYKVVYTDGSSGAGWERYYE